MKKALEIANEKQKEEIRRSVVEFFKTRGKLFFDNGKRRQAVEVYEHLLELQLDEPERKEIRENLSKLYENLGMIREYYRIRKQIEEK
jgi:tetratricopeptide (TPR) repeat protein